MVNQVLTESSLEDKTERDNASIESFFQNLNNTQRHQLNDIIVKSFDFQSNDLCSSW